MAVQSSQHMSPGERKPRGGRWLRTAGRVLAVLLVVLVMLIGAAYAYSASLLNPVGTTPATEAARSFDGRYLLTVSDADMVGTAYADGVLMQVPGERDTLSILSLPLNLDSPDVDEVFASNSVTSWPQVLKTSPDGERAYIIETAAEIADTIETYPNVLTDAPNGRSLTVVTLATGETTVYDVMDYALHLDIHPEEAYVAVGSAADAQPLGILPISTLDDPTTYQFFPVETRDGQTATEITSVSWHPSGNYLAVGIDRSELAFYEVTAGDEGQVTLRQVGAHVVLGNTISYGQFTADGQYYLTSEINWNALPGQLGYVFNPRGEMIAVRFDPTNGAHEVTSRAVVGQSPEGFAVSPDGSLIVAVDMRRTYLPDGLAFIPGTDLNSLSLLTFDPLTGQLDLIDQYGFEGVLPEHAAFDADGDMLAVVIYNDREAPRGDGYIELWNVNMDGDVPALARTGVRIPVARGPHTMMLVP
ncbi:MAG: lactonase family protein [Anaerolineae bacterium]